MSPEDLPARVVGRQHTHRGSDGCRCGCQHVVGLIGDVVHDGDTEGLLRLDPPMAIAEFRVPSPAGGAERLHRVAYEVAELVVADELDEVSSSLEQALAPEPTAPAVAPAEDESVFEAVRDFAVNAARSVLMIDLDTIEQAIAEAERALSLGPILNPTLAREAGHELAQQLRLIRQLHKFRLALEGFRPDEVRS